MTVLQTIQKSAEFLAKRNVESPRLQVECMLAQILRLPRMQLYLNFDTIVTGKDLDALRAMVVRRGKREPLQHILGTVCFCEWEFTVGPQALIPRPETEILAEMGWKWLDHRAASENRAPKALDFGTGTGCLAIALVLKCRSSTVTAVDISPEALALARLNAEKLGASSAITFIQGRNLACHTESSALDLIISNPPYIPRKEIETLQPEVREHDPRGALDGGEDGLDFYRLLAVEGRSKLAGGGRLMLEIGEGQAHPVRSILESQMWVVESVTNDYSGRERFITAALRHE
jgi:release factor glutamine methyltransferase